MHPSRRSRRAAIVAVLALVVGTSTIVAPAGATTAAKKQPRLSILVSNDDGVGADGIDALVEALRELPRVKITVSAPATNQSGTGGKTTPGGVTPTRGETKSGYPAVSVPGFPADSVNAALDMGLKPNLVITGINAGQNLGPVLDLSGTVGAARAAAQRGFPALAVSQGLGDPPDFASGVEFTIDWVKQHRKALGKKPRSGTPRTEIDNLNIPTCPTGEVRGEVDVPAASSGSFGDTPNCASTLEDPPDDVVAFLNGYATLSTVPATPAT